jgi:hypothetical protein
MRSTPPTRWLNGVRIAAAVTMSLAIAQAGLAAGFLTGHPNLRPVHQLNAVLIILTTSTALVLAVLYQRSGGPRWPAAAAVLLLVVEVIQAVLGRSGVTGLHIFLGVLFVASATVFTSYLFRSGAPTRART